MCNTDIAAPCITIIVPVYNVQEYLDECLSTLEEQTCPSIEIICINDGSTDESGSILESWSEKDPRIRVISKSNGGLSSARNAGIKAATSPIICFLDSDDRFTPIACQTIVRTFEETEADIVTFGASTFPAEKSNPWLEQNLSPRDVVYNGFSPMLMFRESSCPFAWRTACKRQFLIDNEIQFDESLRFGEDQVFHATVYPLAKKTVLISDKLYEYRLSRNTSLMQTHANDQFSKLTNHLAIADRVLAQWNADKLIEHYPEDILTWLFDYIVVGALQMPDDQAIEIFEKVSKLIAAYWSVDDIESCSLESHIKEPLLGCLGDTELRLNYFKKIQHPSRWAKLTAPEENQDEEQSSTNANSLKIIGSCRGDGKIYTKIRTANAYTPDQMTIRVLCGTAEFPGNIYPANSGALCSEWVVELPSPQYYGMSIELLNEHTIIGSFWINIERAKWQSRLNYRIRKNLCAQIRDYERSFTHNQYQISFYRFLPKGENVIWRTQISWQGNADERPIIQAIDGKGNHFAPTVYSFEFQKAQHSDGIHHLFISVELPKQMENFVLTAHASDPCSHIKSGFASVNLASYLNAQNATNHRMETAAADDAAYRRWYRSHRAYAPDLAEQRRVAFDFMPRISIITPCYRSNKRFLDAAINSVRKQSYSNWELLLLDASPDNSTVRDILGAIKDERVKYIPLEANLGIVGNTNKGIEIATGEYLAFLDHDDLLEPDALFSYVSAINNNPDIDVLFCDEDVFEHERLYKWPVFKNVLNRDLLYAHNCVTHFLMVRSALIEKIGLSSEDVSGAQDYDLALRALAADALFHHVPHLLYHWRIHEGSTSGDAEGGKPYAEEAGRLALQRHFDQRNIAGTVETTSHPFVYRMRYDVPTPHPMVSIIIPSKDHIDILNTCVKSILDKASYDNYEILIVENNSTEQSTFANYGYLQALDNRIRVITWKDEFNYSKIINFGAKNAKGEYLLFLNNDTEVITPDFIQEMMGYLQRPEVGVVGAKLYFHDGLTQHAGMVVGIGNAIAHVNQDFPPERGGYCDRAIRPGNFASVTGACQMTTRTVFDAVGGYNEDLAVGFNDADFCLSLAKQGLLTVFTPYAALIHAEFVSRGREEADPTKQARWERERDLFMKRWNAIFPEGDPYLNPNLSLHSLYYGL